MKRDLRKYITPGGLDISRVSSQDFTHPTPFLQVLQHSDLTFGKRVRFPHADDPIIGMKSHPHPNNAVPVNLQIGPEPHGLDLCNFHGLYIFDS